MLIIPKHSGKVLTSRLFIMGTGQTNLGRGCGKNFHEIYEYLELSNWTGSSGLA